jgi:plastocyanin
VKTTLKPSLLKIKYKIMRQTKQAIIALLLFGFSACKKDNETSQITLTPSVTHASVGESVSITLNANANASNWTVTPASEATLTYALTTNKVNTVTFNAAGVYTISVRARNIAYDSTRQSLTNAWKTGGGSQGRCSKGIDTASVAITVIK